MPPDHDDGRLATIAVDLESRGNRNLLERVLGDRCYLTSRFNDGFDLAVVDAAGLKCRRDALEQKRAQEAPVILPALLFVDGRRPPDSLIQQELGVTVEDAVRLPKSSTELRARIDNLLRLRELSRRQQGDKEAMQQALEGTSRALSTLHAVNDTLIRIDDEQELLEAVCRVVVEQDSYRLAWVGFVREGDDPCILVDAAAGPAEDYARSLRLGYGHRGDGPTWRSVESGEPMMVPDLAEERVGHDVAEYLAYYRLKSVLSLPLRPQIGPPGALVIYSSNRDDFGRNEQDLLARLASNLEFGINALRTDRERERQKDEIRQLAYSDSLTGLPNRNYLVERLNALLADGAHHGLAVLFVDFDHFKLVNDALGHVAGDGVLRELAKRLSRAVRSCDLVARQGGDEFIVVTAEKPRSRKADEPGDPSASDLDAVRLAQRIRQQLTEPISVHGYKRRLGVSIGISLYPEHGRRADELVDKADAAMYEGKRGGHESIAVFEDSMSRAHERRLSVETRLHGALERGELALYFQPVFHLLSGAVLGAEALLRWQDEDGAWISPGEFIPIAEETGMIVSIGDWVLEQAAQQLAAWHEAGVRIGMAVNLSVRQLSPGGDCTRFTDIVSQHIDPRWFELEVTESVLITDPEEIERTLHELHQDGFRVAVDDFGTGYSSLGRLRNLPLDTLKIDKSFVGGVGSHDRDDMIVRAVTQLARSMGLAPLAEGIETDHRRRQVLSCGCGRGQDFWVSPALPADGFFALATRFQLPPDVLSRGRQRILLSSCIRGIPARLIASSGRGRPPAGARQG